MKIINTILILFILIIHNGCGSSKSFEIIKVGSNEKKELTQEEISQSIKNYNLNIEKQKTDIDIDSILDSELDNSVILNGTTSVSYQLDTSINKFALLLEKSKIGKYSLNSTKIITSYLSKKDKDFLLKTFNTNIDTLEQTITKIAKERYAYVIAIITKDMLQSLVKIANLNPNMKFYIPTINKAQLDILMLENDANNIVFGGIDYQKQIKQLSHFVTQKISMFNIQNDLGVYLKQSVYDLGLKVVFNKDITNATSRFDIFIKNNYMLNNTSMYLNTPIVKSSLIMSQLRIYDLVPYPLLSTQLSYNRLIFSLTQSADRKNLIIANSIGYYDEIVDENSKLLGTNIDFDWINYSICIGIDYFYSYINQTKRDFYEPIENNQIQYGIRFVKPRSHSFEEVFPI